MAVEFWNSLLTAKPIFPLCRTPGKWNLHPQQCPLQEGRQHMSPLMAAGADTAVTAGVPRLQRAGITLAKVLRNCSWLLLLPLPPGAQDGTASRNELDLSGCWKKAGWPLRSELDFFYLNCLCSEEPILSSERLLPTLIFFPLWLSFYKHWFYHLSKVMSNQLFSCVKRISHRSFVIHMWCNTLDGIKS